MNKTTRLKIVMTGGFKNTGLGIYEYFSPYSKRFSRQNDHDISRRSDRDNIVRESLKADVFINYAHNGHFNGQLYLLDEVFKSWEKNKKKGLIINFGSISTSGVISKYMRYCAIKAGLDIFNLQCCKKIESEGLNFKMTNLKLGMLDTIEGRSKPHWPGYGVKAEDICKAIEWLYDQPEDVFIPEMIMTGKSI